MAKLTTIEGIGAAFAEKLNAIGVNSTETLLEEGATPTGRKTLAEKSGISETMILRWVNMSDLFRIKGVGEEYADLLEAAGVDTVPELAQRNVDNLIEKMTAVNSEKKLVRQLPAQATVTGWVSQARDLPRKINH